jgi:hypothetical protein
MGNAMENSIVRDNQKTPLRLDDEVVFKKKAWKIIGIYENLIDLEEITNDGLGVKFTAKPSWVVLVNRIDG